MSLARGLKFQLGSLASGAVPSVTDEMRAVLHKCTLVLSREWQSCLARRGPAHQLEASGRGEESGLTLSGIGRARDLELDKLRSNPDRAIR